MSPAGSWNVWSYDAGNDAWLVVEEDVPASQAQAGAERRAATAKRHGVDGEYVALPAGETPTGGPEL